MSAFSSSTFWTKKQRDVGFLKTVPDVDCLTTSASSPEEIYMSAAQNAEPVIEENPHLEAELFSAVLTAAEVAKHLKIHPSMVRRMAQRGELPALKMGSSWRFDHVQIEGWIKSRTQRPYG
jgi:excisionase family DNA binding protein